MKFTLTLSLVKNEFPIEYRRVILSYIKKSLSECNDGKYYEEFFKDTNQKEYTFSVCFYNAKFNKDKIELGNNQIKIKFSTGERNNVGFKLFSAFLRQKNKAFPLENDNKMILVSLNNDKRQVITNNRAIFKTSIGSGICVRDHDRESNKDKYYVYSDDLFKEKLKVVINNELLKAGVSKNSIDKTIINVIDAKKSVVKHYSRYIDTTVGLIEIKGEANILQYLYDTGIGSRKSAGFGMLELVTQDLQ